MTKPSAAPRPPIADDELLILRTFAAPPPVVFQIWEDAAQRRLWWGPKDFTCTHFEHDFRPGGAWRACIRTAAGVDSWMGGVMREIERDRRLVFTFAWDGGDEQPGVETLVTVSFEAHGGGTVQSFHQTPFLTVETRDSHIGGWSELFDREDAYLQEHAR